MMPPLSMRILSPQARASEHYFNVSIEEGLSVFAMDICSSLAARGYRFEVQAFGSVWPTDISYDCPIVIEQIPDVVRQIGRREPAMIEFPGQGVERTIDLEPMERAVLARCRSGTSWRPRPEVLRLSYSDLARFLYQLTMDFVSLVHRFAPGTVDAEPEKLLRRSLVTLEEGFSEHT